MMTGSKRMTTCREGMLALAAISIHILLLLTSGTIHAITHNVPYEMVPVPSDNTTTNLTIATGNDTQNMMWRPVVDDREYQLARFCLDLVIAVCPCLLFVSLLSFRFTTNAGAGILTTDGETLAYTAWMSLANCAIIYIIILATLFAHIDNSTDPLLYRYLYGLLTISCLTVASLLVWNLLDRCGCCRSGRVSPSPEPTMTA